MWLCKRRATTIIIFTLLVILTCVILQNNYQLNIGKNSQLLLSVTFWVCNELINFIINFIYNNLMFIYFTRNKNFLVRSKLEMEIHFQ